MRAERTGDADLMLQVQHGEEAALRQVYDLYAARLFRILQVLLRDHHQAEDVLQQVILQAWQTASAYDPQRAPLGAWLIQIARSRALDALRRRKPEVLLPVRPGAEPPAVDGHLDLAAALHSLSLQERRAVELSYFGGYPHAEIAQLLGLPLGTVKSTIRRALRKLRGNLQDEEVEHAGGTAPQR